MTKPINKKVAVAMSGGVDSSLSVYLLKKQGYAVTGFFMRLKEGGEVAEAAARRVCQSLDINFYPLNLAPKFRREVVEYFLESYARGLTPNPCVKCNRLIKFGALLDRVSSLGADYLATGHYVQNKKIKDKNGKIQYKLLKGRDKNKDQSYFLYSLGQNELARVLFPLGGYRKEEVRKLASKAGLPYLKKESQDVCFLLDGNKIVDHNIFLAKHLNLSRGLIKTYDNKTVGHHQGLPLYTIGQRKGIEIGGSGPFYVAGFDYKKNVLYVVQGGNDPRLFKKELQVKKINWISGRTPSLPLDCQAVIRYRHKAVDCQVKRGPRGFFQVEFSKPQRAITPGQSIVFYKGEEVLGGGVIVIENEELRMKNGE